MRKSEILALLFLLKKGSVSFNDPADCLDQFNNATSTFDQLLKSQEPYHPLSS